MYMYMYIYRSKGEVYSWGSSSEGQGGFTSLLHNRFPRKLEALDDGDIVSVIASASSSAALSDYGL